MDPNHFEIWFFLLVIALGLLGGFLAGMLGVGGGIIFVPIMQEIVRNHIIESDKVSFVLANSLLIVFMVGIAGSIKQNKLKNTHYPSAIVTGLSAVVSSLALTFIFEYYSINDPKLFSWIFAGILIATAIRMWIGRKDKEEKSTKPLTIPKWKYFIPAGFFAGCITAMTGLGGGVVMVPYFNKFMKLPLKFSTGLSLSVIPIIAFPLLLFYMINKPEAELYNGLQTGHIIWPAVIPLIIAASIASPFGVKIANKMKPETLLKVFLIFIVINITKIIFF